MYFTISETTGGVGSEKPIPEDYQPQEPVLMLRVNRKTDQILKNILPYKKNSRYMNTMAYHQGFWMLCEAQRFFLRYDRFLIKENQKISGVYIAVKGQFMEINIDNGEIKRRFSNCQIYGFE